MTDYRNYKLNKKELFVCIIQSILLGVFAAWLLYRGVYGMWTSFIIFVLCVRKKQKRQYEKRRQQLLLQFKDAIQSVAAAFYAGYSIENAWRESEKELQQLYGEKAFFVQELKKMNTAVSMNEPIEKLLYEFAKRSGCEEIESFAEVFLFAKRGGGDFAKIIQTAVVQISDKIEVEKEVQTVIAAKKMEQNIMNIIPILLVVYLNVTSAEFLEPLYGSAIGICVMTGAFLAYLGAMELAEKIMAIKV